MPIITFMSYDGKETGNTSAAIAISTYMSIEHNMKVLLISTGFNEDTLRESFWEDSPRQQVAQNTVITNGIEGLSRIITSGKIDPKTIRDYTNVILRDRFDVLFGYKGDKEQYRIIQNVYPQLISVANQYYDMVIVDLDKKLLGKTKEEIIRITDVVVATTSQKVKEIQKLNNFINESEFMNPNNTLIAIGRYDDYLKCTAKNVTRNIFRRKKLINTMPYNGKYYEAMQEGTVIDLFLKLPRNINKKDHSYFFIQEVQRLAESINEKWQEVQMKRSM